MLKAKSLKAATEVLFMIAHYLVKNKKLYLDAEVGKGGMTVVAKT